MFQMIAKGSTAKKMNKVINSLGTLAGVQKNSSSFQIMYHDIYIIFQRRTKKSRKLYLYR